MNMVGTFEQLLEDARKLNLEKKYWEAVNLLDDESLIRARNADLFAERAMAWRELDETDKSFSDSQVALELDPNHYPAHIFRGNAYADKGEYDKAIQDFSTALLLMPNSAMAYFKRANALLAKKELDKAIADYDRAIQIDPNFAQAYSNRGIVWDDKGEYDKAIADYTKAIELIPDFAYAYNNRGVSLASKGEFDKAIADYNKTLELAPDYFEVYQNRGDLWKKKKEYSKAIEDLTVAIAHLDKPAEPLRTRGEIWYELKEYQKALKDFEKSLELQPENYVAQFGRDKALAMLGAGVITDKKKADDSFYLFVKAVEGLADEAQREILTMSNRIMDTVVQQIRAYCSKDPGKFVAHYTKLGVADILVSNQEPRLRYYNAVYMNDPEEGKVFLDCFESNAIAQAFENGSQKEENNIYLGSFLPMERRDDLVMWRTYGKDENNVDAAGCCIVIDTNFFDEPADTVNPAMRRRIAEEEGPDSDKQTLNPQCLYKVLYYNRYNGEFSGPDGKEIKENIKNLRTKLLELLSLKDEGLNTKKNTAIDKIVFHILSELRYLFKSADYAFENELRVIQFAPSDSETVQIDPIPFPKKLYINSSRPVQQQINMIVLGPKVRHPEQWIYLEAALKKKNRNTAMKLHRSEVRYQ